MSATKESSQERFQRIRRTISEGHSSSNADVWFLVSGILQQSSIIQQLKSKIAALEQQESDKLHAVEKVQS